MLKSLLMLPGGTMLHSGAGTENAIKSVTLTELVNNGDELAPGSVCANILEATVISPGGQLSLTAGDEVTLYKEDDTGTKHKIGIFILEKPTRPTANSMKLVGYDRMVKLDKDLTGWLKGLTDWPYTLRDFAKMVCAACGLTIIDKEIPNGDFLVQQFLTEATGRQIMQWIGEISCRFCRATAEGKIEFAWYTPAAVSITPAGDSYYFKGGLSFEEYQVEPIDAVQFRLAGNEDGLPWPEVEEGTNSLIITGNSLLRSRVSTDLLPILQVIKSELPTGRYTPCKVSIPATLNIRAGNTVKITDINGKSFTAYVMKKTQVGQKDTLECTGSPRRDSSSAQGSQQKPLESALNSAMQYADKENRKLNQLELLKRLTKEWSDDGLYLDENGKLAVGAAAVLVGGLFAENIYMTGIFLGSGQAFLEPGWQEVNTIYDILIGAIIPEDKTIYDFNGDGRVDTKDVQLCYEAAIGKRSLENWTKAQKSDISVYINPSDPKKAIRIVGRNMWGRDVEYYFGSGSLFNGEDTENNFNMLLTQNQGYLNLQDRVNELQNSNGFSPIANVTQVDDGAVISITDETGHTSAKVLHGKNGAPGYTPVKGVDYFTDDDKAEIVEEIVGLEWSSATGESLTLTDAAEAKLGGLILYGKATQGGTPTPEAPVEIVTAGANGSITVTIGGNGLQNMAVPTPNGLPGIQVSSGGNYTDSTGRLWICDEIDFGRGVYVQRVARHIFTGNEELGVAGGNAVAIPLFAVPYDVQNYAECISNLLVCGKNYADIWNQAGRVGINQGGIVFHFQGLQGYNTEDRPNYSGFINEAKVKLKELADSGTPLTVYYQIATPIETPLTEEELSAYSVLHTNYPTTTITNDSGIDMKVDYRLKGLTGEKGEKGDPGEDGISPTVSVSKSGKVTTIAITDAAGTHTATIYDGEDGADGEDGEDGVAVEEIPAYWQTELEQGVDAINQALEAAGRNKSAFLWYHDAHWTKNSRMSPLLLQYLCNHTAMQKVNFGGDIVDTNTATSREDWQYLYEWRDAIANLPNHHSVRGNHDDDIPGLQTDKAVYAFLMAAEESDKVVRGGDFYYYIDDASEKTRYLYLDTQVCTTSTNQGDPVAVQFVVDALNSVQPGWHIVPISHIWFLYDDWNTPKVGSVPNYARQLLDLFDAYNARRSGSITVAGVSISYNFANGSGKVEFCIGGHTHVDMDFTSTGGIPVILTEADCYEWRGGYDATPGTTGESAVSGIIADYDANKVSVIRIGRGESREVLLGKAVASYTNVLDEAGYVANKRLSESSGYAERDQSGVYLTGYIPVSTGDTLYFKNMTLTSTFNTGYDQHLYIFDSNKTGIEHNHISVYDDAGGILSTVWDESTGVANLAQMTYNGTPGYIRINAVYIGSDSIITINEPIR